MVRFSLEAGTYQEQTEKIIVLPGLAIVAAPESTPCAWAPVAPSYLRHWLLVEESSDFNYDDEFDSEEEDCT
ncbi:hypothetical protein EVAR_56480_1 [Eumeta japonica]|uniref:Uncharacterized protein n=1 Tax=Eumeta variegata TaxID=151549 RepID=A0A4C1XM58_EUMVA|nr:hypothetical protein EVAR_56480_1 [Eumeta japonica]